VTLCEREQKHEPKEYGQLTPEYYNGEASQEHKYSEVVSHPVATGQKY